jgi:hypothetical protein
MLCRICLKKVRTRRNLNNLLSFETHHICESCYTKFPLLPRFDVIPIEGYVMRYHVMSIRCLNHDPVAYMSFLEGYIRLYMLTYRLDIFLVFDMMDSNTLSLLDSLKLGDLFVVTLYENI